MCSLCNENHSHLIHDVYALEAMKQNLSTLSKDTAFLVHGAIDIIESTIVTGCQEQLYSAIRDYLDNVNKR